MVCIYCSGPTKVTNSRSRQGGLLVWRRRACKQCGAIFTTQEGVTSEQALSVQKQSQYEPFQRDALFLSLYHSVKHRKTALTDATSLCDTVINKLQPSFKNGSVPSPTIIKTTLEVLNKFDSAAASHYQAFHT